MKLRLWGTRGSLPAAFTNEHLRGLLAKFSECAKLHPEKTVDELMGPHTYGTNTSCIQILDKALERENAYLLCDAGTGLRDFAVHLSKAETLKKPATFHILLTHLHWDHIHGFPFFIPAYLRGHKIVIHSYHYNVEEAFRKQMSPPCFPVPLDALDAQIIFDVQPPCKPFSIAGINVTSIQQNHPGVSYGYRFEKDGKAIVYSTDCEHTEYAHESGYPMVEFYKNADILLFDAMYSLADASINKANWGHSSNMMGVKLAVRAQVKHLILFHHEPTCTDDELDKFFANTKKYAEIYRAEHSIADEFPHKISLAYDGMEIE